MGLLSSQRSTRLRCSHLDSIQGNEPGSQIGISQTMADTAMAVWIIGENARRRI
jgi:hypothetical protein